MTRFTLGADPEMFYSQNNVITSAHGIIPGSKEEPFPVDSGAIQVDGMALEINVEPVELFVPGTHGLFRDRILTVREKLEEHLPENSGIELKASYEFGEGYVDNQPDEAKELGCDPDYNAYTLERNPSPVPENGLRTCAGHIHIGWGHNIPHGQEHLEVCAHIIKFLDVFVGAWGVSLEEEDGRDRRSLYGRAGAFRPKPYGVEYRTPSNFWLKDNHSINTMVSLVQTALTSAQQYESLEEMRIRGLLGFDFYTERNIQDNINNFKQGACLQISNAIRERFL